MPPQSSLYPTLMLSVELRGTDVEPMASDTVFTSFLCAGEVEAVKTTASSRLVSVFRENNPVELQMSWETLQSVLSWDLSYQESRNAPPHNKTNLFYACTLEVPRHSRLEKHVISVSGSLLSIYLLGNCACLWGSKERNAWSLEACSSVGKKDIKIKQWTWNERQ